MAKETKTRNLAWNDKDTFIEPVFKRLWINNIPSVYPLASAITECAVLYALSSKYLYFGTSIIVECNIF